MLLGKKVKLQILNIAKKASNLGQRDSYMMTQLFPSDTWQDGGIPTSKSKSDLFPLKETPTSFSNNVSTTFALSNLQKQFNITIWTEKGQSICNHNHHSNELDRAHTCYVIKFDFYW